MRRRLAFGALGAAAGAIHAALVLTAPWNARPGLFLLLVAAAAAVSGAAALAGARLPRGRAGIAAVTGIAALLHAMWLLPPVTLSDDLPRYVHEGREVRAGRSPYAAPPADRHADVAHGELSSCYPPLSLAAFAIAGLGGSRGLRILFAACSVLATFAIALRLAQRGAPPARAAAYGWAPLPAIEFAASGHHDALGIALLVAALVAAGARRPWLGAAAWALAAGSKGLSLVTLPAFWRTWGVRERVVAVVGAALLLLPLALAWGRPHSGVRAYALRWEHNALVYGPLSAAIGDPVVARAIVAAALVVAVLLAARALPIERAVLWALGATLLLSPTLHPWYAGWVLALAPIVPSVAAWILGQTVLVSYALPGVQEGPGFARVPWTWTAAMWAPVVVAAIVESAWQRRRGRRDR